ncbi:MAG: hypothetical protein HYY43_05615 [Deltaproteobacteria bacterium]|nr:hypothetical protein [Deltaproteobacteria bacterium]
MLRLLFNRESKFVLAVEMAGLAGFAAVIIAGKFSFVFGLYALAYIFIRFCSLYNWYAKFNVAYANLKKDELGIRLHFKKAIVPASYIIAISNWLLVFRTKKTIIYFSFALLLFILHVNLILIYLHLKDKDPTPPNYFSGTTSEVF